MPRPLHILIVDDDEDDREMFCEAISDLSPGIECTQAASGEEALSILNKTATLPDYIFLDLNMPRMNGKECLKKLKATTVTSAIPVIIYSTSKQKNEIEEARAEGALHFISKPSSLIVLKKEITHFFTHVLKTLNSTSNNKA